ncbi:hypothetical protein Niako_1081 [Niastella koreensis GR20-10]|uniref:Uncharacterized protein n=3 Tax=Niastella koreensis TaxID=354356 RepID=G8THM9_NIAKG|nr:hypothetical protein [Niastella koreensis]AEV97457.1 hypothetical protein Niako_1081 [Niastella koreensis GR20-10]
MKMNLTQMKSFLTFDLPLETRYIGTTFTTTHHQLKVAYPGWTLRATRQKLLARYWFWNVLMHFVILYSLAVVLTLPFNTHLNQFYLAAVVTVGAISFTIITITQYGPRFFSDFLPKLETITAEFEARQNELLKGQLQIGLKNQIVREYEKLGFVLDQISSQRERLDTLQTEMPKCRREQLHTFSLVLIYYAFYKSAGLKGLQVNDKTARQLMKLLGKDQGGIKDNLQLILGKKQELSQRNRTEIQNRFNDVYAFFEELGFSEGISLLKNMESKFRE